MAYNIGLLTLVVLIGSAIATLAQNGDPSDAVSPTDNSIEDTADLFIHNQPDKREFKLRSHNPLHIYNQWLRQPKYPTKQSGFREESVSAVVGGGGSHDIPRRLIRNNKTQHLGAPPLFVWNHQLLPNFHDKRRPGGYLASLRRDYATIPKSNKLSGVKRSNLAWILLPKSYDENYEGRLNEGYQTGDYRAEYDWNDPASPVWATLEKDDF